MLLVEILLKTVGVIVIGYLLLCFVTIIVFAIKYGSKKDRMEAIILFFFTLIGGSFIYGIIVW